MKFISCVALGLLVVIGCDCKTQTAQHQPKIEVLDDGGVARSAVDFGQVQVNTTANQTVRVRNAGVGPLTLSKVALSNPVFAVTTTLPVSLDPSNELQLGLSFTPTTPDQQETGTATISSDDPSRPTVALSLSGTGVTAVAAVQPTALAFGDVYVTENSVLTLTLTNSGANALAVQDVHFTAAVDPSLTADFTTMKKTFAPGESAQVSLTFAPTAILTLQGAVEVVLPTGMGTVSVAISGRGVQAVPRVCFKFADEGTEHCTDMTNTFLSLTEGSLCDNRLYPNDGGAIGCIGLDGGPVASSRTGTFYVRNEGNTPVPYTLQFNARVGAQCADGGSSIDFEFANAPDGGLTTWTQPTVSLPTTVSNPQPWETTPLTVTYVPQSHCANDAADQARVAWTRQDPPGKNRPPQTVILNLTGQSLLPRGVPQDITMSGSTPQTVDFLGAGNAGDAPLVINSVALWEAEGLADGGRGTTPFQPCPGTTGDCAMFGFSDGGVPVLPVTLAGTGNPVPPVTKVLGRIVFGPGATPPANIQFHLFGVITTSDPYNPQVVMNLKGTRQ